MKTANYSVTLTTDHLFILNHQGMPCNVARPLIDVQYVFNRMCAGADIREVKVWSAEKLEYISWESALTISNSVLRD